jgi:FKBP-type peptidyl-prolyl cis-trans isomerase 2
MDMLLKAVRYNHEISGEKFKLKVNVKEELDLYENRIMNISLPHRFGMYRP